MLLHGSHVASCCPCPFHFTKYSTLLMASKRLSTMLFHFKLVCQVISAHTRVRCINHCHLSTFQLDKIWKDIYYLSFLNVIWRRSIMVLRLSRKQKVLGSIPSVAFLPLTLLFWQLAFVFLCSDVWSLFDMCHHCSFTICFIGFGVLGWHDYAFLCFCSFFDVCELDIALLMMNFKTDSQEYSQTQKKQTLICSTAFADSP